MRYILLKRVGSPDSEFLNLELEEDKFRFLKMYFDTEDIASLKFYDTENPELENLIHTSIRDLVFILLYEKSKELGNTFEQLSSRAVDALIKNDQEEFSKIKLEKRVFYFNSYLSQI